MSPRERPQLRPHLAAASEGRGGYVVWDQLRLAERRLHVTNREMSWLQLLDGRRTLAELHAVVVDGENQTQNLAAFNRLLDELDQALFLDGPSFRACLLQQADNPIRPPACTPSYGDDPALLRRSLDHFFSGPGGPGHPGRRQPDPHLRAAFVPHIDYGRGGLTYAWAFKPIFERAPASLFVIIGTSHYSYHRFTLTRKHFQTPLGIAPTDQTYIDRLVAHYGDGLFDDELPAHLPEHSIELEVVFLQYLFGDTPFRIVPLVVGSFHDRIASGRARDEGADFLSHQRRSGAPWPEIRRSASGQSGAVGPQPASGRSNPAPVWPLVQRQWPEAHGPAGCRRVVPRHR